MKKDVYGLTNPQKSIWYMEEIFKGTAINNICGSLTIHEVVDFEKFEEAVHLFVGLNDSFHIRICLENSIPKQYFGRLEEKKLEIIDIPTQEDILAIEKEMVSIPFKVIEAPLFEFKLFRLPNGHGGFVVNTHHIISDAGTLSLIGSQIAKIYANLKNEELVDSDVPSYEDYILTETEYLASEKFQKDETYWNGLFQTLPEVATLPASFKNAKDYSSHAKRKVFELEKDLVNQIRSICEKEKLSIFNFFMAVFSIYISKVTHLNEFVIGTPILNRTNAKEKHTSGMFISIVPFQISMKEQSSFLDFVSHMAKDSLSMLRHQRYPYQYLLENLRKKFGNIPNLYDILFSYQITKAVDKSIDLPYSVHWTEANEISSSVNIHIHDNNDSGSLALCYDYLVDKYTEEEITHVYERTMHIIHQLLENIEIPIKNIEVIAPREKEFILQEVNNTFVPYQKNKTVLDLFEEQVQKNPNQTAFIFENQTFSYQELNKKANLLAHYFIQNHIQKKDIVGIMMHRSPEMIISILGILKIGATYLPIDPNYPIDRINYMLSDSHASTLLVHSDTVHLEIDSVCQKINVNLEEPFFETSSISNINLAKPNHLIYLIYTSGSTGNPKGVMVTHQNMMNFIVGEKQFIDFSIDKVMLSVTTICFDIFALELWGALTSGIPLVLASDTEQINPAKLKDLCLEHHVTMIQTTPSRFSTLLADDSHNSDFWELLTDIMVGGEPFPKTLLAKMQNLTHANIFNMYGPTETTVWSTIKNLTRENDITIGSPIANTTCYILGKDNNLLPLGVPGKLYIGGDGVTAGYWNREELTKEKFLASPFGLEKTIYDTGDLAYINSFGEIVHLGRTDFQVKIRGHRIELEEIESDILKFPKITDCIVIPVSSSSQLCAYYISREEINVSELRSFLAKKLPNYMVPNFFLALASFPHTPNGKIDKKALPLPQLEKNAEILPARNEIDSFIIQELTSLLQLKAISISDSFFEIGGDSLTAIRLATKVSHKYHIDFMVKDIFENPILKDMSDLISSKSKVKDTFSIEKAAIKSSYPLSATQKRIYYSAKVAGEDTVLYNMPCVIILNQKPDIDRLHTCFRSLIQRHSSLRTYFEVDGDTVCQKILPTVDFEIEEITDNSQDMNQLVHHFVKPFSLETAPLFRICLVAQKEQYLLLFDMHHIISDGSSLSILIKELSKFYNGNNLPKMAFNYIDYVEWEQKQLKSTALEKSKKFWLSQFKEEIPVLDLPTDYARPSIQSFEGAKIVQTIPENLGKSLKGLAKKLDVSPFMLLFSCYAILLSKYTRQEDIVIGTPSVARSHEEFFNVIGMFVNSLPLKNHIDSSMSFYDFLNTVKANCIQAFEHQNYPFDDLVNHLNITRDISRNPLFDTMFTYQNEGITSITLDQISGTCYIPDTKISKFDLSLEVVPKDHNQFYLTFEYCTKLFTKDTIERFSSHFIILLQKILANFDTKIEEIDLLSEEERHKILFEFNDTKTEYPREKTVIELFEEQVKKTPHQTAVVFETQKLTFQELNEKANALASYLNDKDVSSHDTVCIFLDKSLEMLVSILAILKLGATYLPIDIGYPEDRIHYILQDSHAKQVLASQDTISRFPFTDTAICVDFGNKEIYSHVKLSSHVAGISPEDIAYIMYTSGSTGKPKGVMVKNQNIVRLVKNSTFIHFEKHERILQTGSIVFDACTFEIWAALLNGFELYIMKKEELLDASLLQSYLLKNRITTLWITAPLFNQLCEDNPHMFHHVKHLLTGGDVLSPKHIAMAKSANPNLTIINGYGPTENTTFSTCFTIDKLYKNRIPIGKPIANSTAYIVSSNSSLLPIGLAGELWVGGDGVSAGYFNNVELTKEKFIPNPFGKGMVYKTGDLAKWLPDGNIDFIGRIDNQIKIRGFRVELNEINHRLANFSPIKECATLILNLQNEKTICSYFVSKNQNKIDEYEIKDYMSKYLPNYMIPTFFCQLEKLPINANGKIDKNALPTNFKMQIGKEIVPPTNEVENKLLSIYQLLLNCKEIGITHNFFEIGGDSLTAMKVQLECNKQGLQLTYSDIFNFPTVEKLAKHVESSGSSAIPIKRYDPRTYYPASSAQKRIFLASTMDKRFYSL